jgi:thiol-disulfide isomerase/thioredoxin
VKALEEKSAAQPGAARPVATAPAPDPNEDAAGELMKDAQLAINNADFDTAKSKLADIQSKYPQTRAAKAAARISDEIGLIGQAAPPLTVDKWFQGKADYSSNKATLVVFWEQWCPHCKEEMPKMEPLSEKWKDKLTVIGVTKVTKSATDDLVVQFLKDNNIKFPIAKEKDGAISQAYSVSGIPAAAIVKGGKVIWRGHPNKLTDDFITKLLG